MNSALSGEGKWSVKDDSVVDLEWNGVTWVSAAGNVFTTSHTTTRRPRRPLMNQKIRIHDRDAWMCWWCGGITNLSIDHIIPRSQGGTNDDWNLQTLCVSCNQDKGDGPNIPTETALRRRAQNQDLREMRKAANDE